MTDAILPTLPATRPLYAGGPEISCVAWGMWRFGNVDLKTARARVDAAFEAGITLFDTADIYGCDMPGGFGHSEHLLGQILADAPALRDQMVLASKGGIVLGTPYNSSRDYIAGAIDASLIRLGVEHIDLWQVHRPDMLTHPGELSEALQTAVASGKVGAVGVSNFTPAQTDALRSAMDIPLVSTQPEYSPLCLDPLLNGQFDAAMQHGMAVLAWSPLGGGRIADPATDREKTIASALDTVAETFGVSRAAVAFAWIAAHPARPIPIIGSQTPARIADARDIHTVTWTRTAWYDVLQAAMGQQLP
ncbi:aldo/keto reductase [Pontixanthobacter sp.]|uniref:aldo/keto reductase n=1 Tax=Pontixanthobacter sp. TaxID=2792078 RepID=UPI003C7B2B9D